ncbi:hypothetical protein P691DRAFT_770204 [Macrolepiota fuliginosa MF-IS2]|uniref:Uncharacterized protein n=1 Tax=Macrolepiota fuliginosa MF-IS2 TaxID=1400762 RepID=A0A9P6CBH3_9AGAR|nr:hypothetical protein P691DRAFT_770204 [Macrolepiota fuliginosa MF-IS2]
MKAAPESADAQVALRAIYYSRYAGLMHPMGPNRDRRRLEVDATGVVGSNDSTSVVDSELIGRQAFLLDEPLWRIDGRVLRQPLGQSVYIYDCMAPSRGEETLLDLAGDEASGHYWGIDLALADRQEQWGVWTVQWIATWLSNKLKTAMTGVEHSGALSAGLQVQPPVGEAFSDPLIEEMYHKYIDEEQCCELGGWLDGS